MFRSLVTAAAALVFITACGSDRAASPNKAVTNLAREPEILGSWGANCKGTQILDLSGKSRLTFTPAGFTNTVTLYSDAVCNAVVGEAVYTGTYVLGEGNGSDPVRTLDLKMDKVTMKITDAKLAKAAGGVNFCGKKDWALGEVADLTKSSTLPLCPLIDVPADYFDIVRVHDGRLYTGSVGHSIVSSPANKAADRPTKLNDVPLVRQ